MTLAFSLALATAVVFAIILWSRTRRRTVQFDVPHGDVHTLMPSIAALTWGSVVEGNAVRIVQDTAVAIAAARREILLQNPYFLPDRHARRLYTEALRRGVRVRLMLPTSGTSDFPIVQHASHYWRGGGSARAHCGIG